MKMNIKKELAKQLKCSVKDIKSDDWMICTAEEANDYAKERILESLSYFKPEFLAFHAKPGIMEKHIIALQLLEEDCLEALKHLIDDMDILVKDALMQDGRAHFIGTYDGQEIELFNGKLLAYRS